MEALLNLEDKWKLSAQGALLFVFTAFAVVGLCATAMVKKKRDQRKQPIDEELCEFYATNNWIESGASWGSIKEVFTDSMRWSRVSKWEEMVTGCWRQAATPPLLAKGRCEKEVGLQSHKSVSPVWQRPILMGERCELPRFSGLILYNERGQLLQHSEKGAHQGKPAAVKTLKDLLCDRITGHESSVQLP